MTDPQVPPNDPPKNDPPPANDPPKNDPPKDDGKSDPPKNDPPKDDDRGYPKDTAVADMTVEQREAYWKYHAKKHETAFKSIAGKDMTPEKIAELLEKQEKADRDAMSAQEQAVADARKEAREEALKEAREQSVRAIMDAHVAASGLDKANSDDQDVIDAIQALNPSSFIADDHVEADRLTKVLNRIVPVRGGGSRTGQWPDTGQGPRNTGTTSGKDAGTAEAARRWPDKVKADS